jgi:hypothetical protein
MVAHRLKAPLVRASHHPACNNQQPTTNNQQPTTNNQQPTTNNQEPRTNTRYVVWEYPFDLN